MTNNKMNHSIIDQLSRPLHDLRISVIDRCNFRCPYCMPQEEFSKNYEFLKKQEWLSFGEIVRLVKIFTSLGVSKVRLTGGEPLLRPNLTELIKNLKQIERINDLALTTNGSLLTKHAADLKKSGLNRLTVSLDTMDSRVFKAMSGNKGSLKHVLDGIKAAEDAGFDALKINVVVQRGVNDHTLLDLVEHFYGTNHILRFIEYMDVGNCNHWESKYVVPSEEILNRIKQKFPLKPIQANYFGEVALRHQFLDGRGEIGFISSVTKPFCQSCTRARISTDGKFFTCLFANTGTDLKTPLRQGQSDTEILDLIKNIWQKRDDRYSELRGRINQQKTKTRKIEMFQIGG